MHSSLIATIARALASREFVVLRFNFRGVGHSEGRHDGGFGEWQDVAGAVAALMARDDVDPERVYLAGWSFGARVGLDYRPEITPEELRAKIAAYDAVIVRSRTKLRRDVLEQAARLRVIGRAGSGLDNIDVAYARERGIAVRNAPGANANAVAELALALMLLLARRLPEALESIRAKRPRKFKGIELMEKTLGLIGFGNIGRRVAELARGFGMRVLAHDPLLDPAQVPEPLRVVPLCNFEKLLGQSDLVSLHVPRLDDTRGLSDAEVERMVKEAEKFREEDRQRKEEVEVRNNADQAAYTAEKALRDLGDKVPEDVRQEVEGKIAAVRSALQGGDTSQITSSSQELSAAMQKVSSPFRLAT
jgi:pimeloyl-ACP methyl ester carboxylesterase